MKEKVRVLKTPCTYQGGKQRLASQIVDCIFKNSVITEDTVFYDLCCGSGAITVELINRGISSKNIVMLDKSSWGAFWKAIGDGTFDLEYFLELSAKVPRDKAIVQGYMKGLSKTDALVDECYNYILLQSASFGGKQIWRDNKVWKNTSFRSYWMPTETSNRKSPVNPMQPSIEEIEERVKLLVEKCKGVQGYHTDIYNLLDLPLRKDSIIYIDPPYKGTTGYGFNFDVLDFVNKLKQKEDSIIYVSEKEKLCDNAVQLNFSKNKGGISGTRKNKTDEWLNIF